MDDEAKLAQERESQQALPPDYKPLSKGLKIFYGV